MRARRGRPWGRCQRACQGFVFGSLMPEVGGVCSLGGGRVGPWGEAVRRVPKGY